MSKIVTTILACSMLLLSGCGYHLGGLKNKSLSHVDTISIGVFTNDSLEPLATGLVTNSLVEALQRDGTFKIKSKGHSDARIEGRIASISYVQLRSSQQDTYQSSELGLNLTVDYKVIDSNTNKVLMASSVTGQASLFNMGNQQTSKTNALSYAARMVGTLIADVIANG